MFRALDLSRAALSARDEVREAYREGFEDAKSCLTDEEAYCLTVDVEADCWADSKARAALEGTEHE